MVVLLQTRALRRAPLAVLAVLSAVCFVLVSGEGLAGANEPVEHGQLAPDSPRRDLPRVQVTPQLTGNGGRLTNRQVFASEIVGRYIVVGGNFLDIELGDGTLVRQPFLAAFHLDTGEFVDEFRPVLDGWVRAIHVGPDPDTVLVGGEFNRITGPDGISRARNSLAKLNLPDGSVDRNWVINNIAGKVTSLDVHGSRLFVGGDFKSVERLPIEHLFEADVNTADLNTAFDLDISSNLTRTILAAEVNPAGNRLMIGHRATAFGGVARRGTAVVDITNPAAPALTAHQMSTGLQLWTRYYDIQDAAMSPDGSHMAIVGGTATVSDYVHYIPTTEAPGQIRWTKFMRDSSFGVDISDVAVYVSGHFCKIDEGPGFTELMSPKPYTNCTGAVAFGGGVWRTQLAALNPADGTPLTWNPGNTAFVGGRHVKVTERGLLTGFDGMFTDGIRTGAFAFFDFGPGAEDTGPPPPPSMDRPADGENLISPLIAEGTATDDLVVNRVELRIFRTDDNTYLQPDGSFSNLVRVLPASLTDPGTASTEWSFTSELPEGTYNVLARTVDLLGQRSAWTTRTITIGGLPACSVVLDANGQPELSWGAVAGNDSYQVRRNGNWLATVTGVSNYTDTTATPGDYSYVVRYRLDGVRTDLPCDPDPITVPDDDGGGGGGGADACSVVINANGQPELDWPDADDSYQVRRNGNWLATVTGVSNYTDTTATPGDYSYVVRYRLNGVRTDLPCDPDPITVG